MPIDISAVTTLIIGAVVGQLSKIFELVKDWLVSRKEANRRKREDELKEKESRRALFLNAITNLSKLVTIYKSDIQPPNEQLLERIEETHTWLNDIALRYPSGTNTKVNQFNECLEDFINNPSQWAGEMRDYTLALATQDKILFPEAVALIETKQPEQKTQQQVIHFSMQIDDDFRREQVVNKAIQVPRIHNFALPLSQLTQSQRQLLADIYFSKHREIPTAVNLPMPVPNNPNGDRWRGKINPTEDNMVEILELWEQNYRVAFSKMNQPAKS